MNRLAIKDESLDPECRGSSNTHLKTPTKCDFLKDGPVSRERDTGCIGFGSVVAVILSVALNHSLGWALLHFLMGWIYVLYAVLFRTKQIVPALRAMFL